MIEVGRRSFITGLIALVAAPAIVRTGWIMPVKSITTVEDLKVLLARRIKAAEEIMIRNMQEQIFGDIQYGARTAGLSGLIAKQEASPFRFKQMLSEMMLTDKPSHG